MSLQMRLGARGNLLHPHAGAYKQVQPLCCLLLPGMACAADTAAMLSYPYQRLHLQLGPVCMGILLPAVLCKQSMLHLYAVLLPVQAC